MSLSTERDLAGEIAEKVGVVFHQDAAAIIQDTDKKCRVLLHNYIGTEHLLWSLADVPSLAQKALNDLGIEPQKVQSALVFIIGRGDRMVLGEPGFTPRCRKIVEIAESENKRRKGRAISSTDLLLGLVREGEGIAAGIFESLGVPFDTISAKVRSILNREDLVHRELELTVAQRAQLVRIEDIYKNPSVPKSSMDLLFRDLSNQLAGFRNFF